MIQTRMALAAKGNQHPEQAVKLHCTVRLGAPLGALRRTFFVLLLSFPFLVDLGRIGLSVCKNIGFWVSH